MLVKSCLTASLPLQAGCVLTWLCRKCMVKVYKIAMLRSCWPARGGEVVSTGSRQYPSYCAAAGAKKNCHLC